jgi:hypothetical protein
MAHPLYIHYITSPSTETVGRGSRTRITDPQFFLHDRQHWRLPRHFPKTCDFSWELILGYFQLDRAACHTSKRALEGITNFWGDKFISKRLWHLGFQIWLCRTSSCGVCWRVGCLKTNHELLTTCKETLQSKLLQSPRAIIQRRVGLCLQVGENQFQPLL